MFIRDLKQCTPFVAGDETILREILHPEKESLSIRYSLAHALLHPGTASQPHVLSYSEVYYILSGSGIMHIDDESETVHASQVVYIPPGARQWIENTASTELAFLCIVDPAWQPDCEKVL